MKNNRILVTSALVSLFAAASAFASTSIDRPAMPVPVKVVHPTDLPRAYENATVYVKFTLDQNGVPHDVAPVGQMPKDLALRLIPAVASWQFTPFHDANGHPVQGKAVLPLQLVDGRF